ncbi:MAG TPA: hypothetical protein VFX70_11170 [Mycobacteriales bacterium]|nr:hypothetical protein [Mycobacteriales bacterium]
MGYDSSLHMLEFRKVVGIKTDDGTGHLSTRYYEPDPADRATHRLPLSPDAGIVSVDAELCPPTHCPPPEVMLGTLLSQDGQPVALIQVDASDHIYLVNQLIFGMGADAPPPQSA